MTWVYELQRGIGKMSELWGKLSYVSVLPWFALISLLLWYFWKFQSVSTLLRCSKDKAFSPSVGQTFKMVLLFGRQNGNGRGKQTWGSLRHLEWAWHNNQQAKDPLVLEKCGAGSMGRLSLACAWFFSIILRGGEPLSSFSEWNGEERGRNSCGYWEIRIWQCTCIIWFEVLWVPRDSSIQNIEKVPKRQLLNNHNFGGSLHSSLTGG